MIEAPSLTLEKKASVLRSSIPSSSKGEIVYNIGLESVYMLPSLSVTVVSPVVLFPCLSVAELSAGFSGVVVLTVGLSAVVFPAGEPVAELSAFLEAHAERDRHTTRAKQGKMFFSLFPFLLHFCLNGSALGGGTSRPP